MLGKVIAWAVCSALAVVILKLLIGFVPGYLPTLIALFTWKNAFLLFAWSTITEGLHFAFSAIKDYFSHASRKDQSA